MRSACVYRRDRYLGLPNTDGESLEPIAALANERDTTDADRDVPTYFPVSSASELRLHVLAIAHGFAGSYIVESRRLDNTYSLSQVSSERFDRLLQALEALAVDQRAALDLGEPQMAALTMLDELRGLYATGELATARRMSERLLKDLEEAFGTAAPHGEAKLGRPIVRSHGELGRLCEQALGCFVYDTAEAFGRVRQLFRVAADLGGGERTGLETRPDLARRTAFQSTEPAGFEMIALPYGVVHPTQWPAVAARLGLSIDEARRRLYPQDENDDVETDVPYGPRGHAALLGDDLVVRAIPLIPEDERPALYFPRTGPHEDVTRIEDPLSGLYDSLRGYQSRHQRLVELGAGEILHDADSAVVQRIVDRLAAAAAPLELSTIDGWGAQPPRDRVRLSWRGKSPLAQDDGSSEPSGTPPSCVWMTADHIAVAIDDVVRIISIANRQAVHELSTSYARLQACDDSGRYLVTTAYSVMFEQTGEPDAFGCYDTESKTWLAELPAHIPAVTFGKDQPEDGQLFEVRRDASYAVEDGDRPTAMCWAHGNRAVLLSGDYASIQRGGIRSTNTCRGEVAGRVLEARAIPVPVLTSDGEVVEPNGDLEQDNGAYKMYEAVPCAIARLGDSWRVLLPSRHVADLDRTHFQIGYPFRAASFSPDARRIALVADDELQIVDIADRAIVWRYALARRSDIP